MNLDDTIVAIATPPGRGGIGVVRLAGPEACSIAMPMLRLKHDLESGRAIFGELIDPCGSDTLVRPASDPAMVAGVATSPAGGDSSVPACQTLSAPPRTSVSAPHEQPIDEVVVTYFAKPHSYTTDDIIEISAHGSPNGRIDLTQAEAVRDLIDSQTLYQAKIAAQQLEGALSRRLQPLKQKLVELIALLEAGIDFAEDDVSVLPAEEILKHIKAVRAPLEELGRSFAYGKIVHEGLTLAIVGRPNVGKSSLFNRLVERERAIVTSTPGTTRDLVTETVSLGGIPVKLVDTAGIRRALDEAESIGIQKSMQALADADLVLVVLDASQPESTEDQPLLDQIKNRTAIVVENKADLWGLETRTSRRETIRTSALTGEGTSELRAAILHHVTGDAGFISEAGFLTNTRHQSLVRDSLAALDAAQTAVQNRVPHEMLLLDLYSALRPLDEITGATTNDDILNLIFSRFCIGK